MDYEKAVLDPAAVFARPEDVCDASELNHAQKVEVLKRWEYDARQLIVAEEENMPGDSGELLTQVLNALDRLGETDRPGQSAPTKQGGA